MAAYQYVYHMDGVSKTYPGGKKCFENVRLSFLPGVKIGVVGVNGTGKSTLMRIMAGIDKDFTGEAWHAEGATVGYLEQEPILDPTLSVRDNVMLAVSEKKAILDKYNELAMNYSEETADEMASLQDQIDADDLWNLDADLSHMRAQLVRATCQGFHRNPCSTGCHTVQRCIKRAGTFRADGFVDITRVYSNHLFAFTASATPTSPYQAVLHFANITRWNTGHQSPVYLAGFTVTP